MQLYSYSALRQATNDFSEENRKEVAGLQTYEAILDQEAVRILKIVGRSSVPDLSRFLQLQSNEHLVDFIGAAGEIQKNSKEWCLVYRGSHGSSVSALRSRLSATARLYVANAAAHGLAYLHSLGVVHRAVCSKNVMLMPGTRVAALCGIEFGLLQLVGLLPNSTVPPSPKGYLDPLMAGTATLETDVYAFGAFLHELITGEDAYQSDRSPQTIVEWAAQRGISTVADTRVGEWPSNVLVIIIDIAKKCCNSVALERPKMTEVATMLQTLVSSVSTETKVKKPAKRAREKAKTPVPKKPRVKSDPDADYAKAEQLYYSEAQPEGVLEAITLYERAATHKHAGAMYAMSDVYGHGLGDKKPNPIKSQELIEKSFRAGYPLAVAVWNLDYDPKIKGGVEKNREGVATVTKLANEGDARAMYVLGWCHDAGKGTAVSHADAFKWYIEAAQRGHPLAANNAAVMIQDSRHDKTHDKTAFHWFLQAATRGHLSAQFTVASYLLQGMVKDIEDVDTEAVKWLKLAAERGSDVACYYLGEAYMTGMGIDADPALAYKWTKDAAEQRLCQAEHRLAAAYENAEAHLNVAERDPVKAHAWMKKAAAHGSVLALNNMGYYLEHGFGVKQDIVGAYRYYERAAKKGYAPAMVNTGVMLEQGIGVKMNHTKSAEWYKKAADLGNGRGIVNYAECLEEGRGVPMDRASAKVWWTNAIECGDADVVEEAKEGVQRCE